MTLEIYMNESSMPPTCLAVGLPNLVAQLHKARTDLEKYAKRVNVPTRTDTKDWPSQLSVIAESSSAFQAIFCRPILDLAFGKEVRALHAHRGCRSGLLRARAGAGVCWGRSKPLLLGRLLSAPATSAGVPAPRGALPAVGAHHERVHVGAGRPHARAALLVQAAGMVPHE